MNEPVLYYTPGTCALTELIVLEWIGAPYRACRVAREERQGAAFLALNPHGSVPAMRVGGRVLVENPALLLHLGDAHPGAELVPRPATPERDAVHRWLSYLVSRYHVAHYPIFKAARYTDRPELHEHLREVAIERVADELAFLDRHLAGREHFEGGARSVLDAYFVAMGRWGRRFHDYAERFPEVDRFLRRWDADAGVRRALAIESGERPGPDGAFLGHVPLA
ncbi:MAG TPA: glutathione S-transferase [Planctomycetota bacterium]|nr:glutathione S-transferase [Planctomycetota bacterium]